MDRSNLIVRAVVAALAVSVQAFVIMPASAQQTSAIPPSGTNLTIPTGDSPVVRIQVRSGNLTIRTWDRQQVQIESGDQLQTRRFAPNAVAAALARGSLPVNPTSIQTPNGPLTLPAEQFSLSSVPPGDHDGVIVQAPQADATITIPQHSALIAAIVGLGTVDLQGYQSGTFFTIVHNGAIRLQDVSGSGYVQVARGRIAALNSSFDHVRARTAGGNIVFEGCSSKQIEVSSINGSVAYDNGTFDRGLARFESQNGNVALGVAQGSSAQIGAHSSAGKIFSSFDRSADVRASGNDTQANLGNNGPVVTASSERGGVYLYDGAFKAHPALRNAWQPLGRVFQRAPRPPQSAQPPRVRRAARPRIHGFAAQTRI